MLHPAIHGVPHRDAEALLAASSAAVAATTASELSMGSPAGMDAILAEPVPSKPGQDPARGGIDTAITSVASRWAALSMQSQVAEQTLQRAARETYTASTQTGELVDSEAASSSRSSTPSPALRAAHSADTEALELDRATARDGTPADVQAALADHAYAKFIAQAERLVTRQLERAVGEGVLFRNYSEAGTTDAGAGRSSLGSTPFHLHTWAAREPQAAVAALAACHAYPELTLVVNTPPGSLAHMPASQLCVWSLKAAGAPEIVATWAAPVRAAAWLPSAPLSVAAGDDCGRVSVWDMRAPKSVAAVSPLAGALSQGAPAVPASRVVHVSATMGTETSMGFASVHADGAVALWDARNLGAALSVEHLAVPAQQMPRPSADRQVPASAAAAREPLAVASALFASATSCWSSGMSNGAVLFDWPESSEAPAPNLSVRTQAHTGATVCLATSPVASSAIGGAVAMGTMDGGVHVLPPPPASSGATRWRGVREAHQAIAGDGLAPTTGVAWCPQARAACLLASVTAAGQLSLCVPYTEASGSVPLVASVPGVTGGVPATALAWCASGSHLLVGDARGDVRVLRVPGDALQAGHATPAAIGAAFHSAEQAGAHASPGAA